MSQQIRRNVMMSAAAAGLFFAGWAMGQPERRTEKTTIHCVAWTAKKGMTGADWENFKKGFAMLPDKFPGMRRLWAGKLAEPVTFSGLTRDHAIAFEFDSLAAKRDYSASPNRPAWQELFATVREPGSSSFDLVGE